MQIDECEAVSIMKKIITVRITDSEIAEMKENIEKAVSVRLVQKKAISSASSSDLNDVEIIKKTLKTGHLLQPRGFWKSLPYPLRHGFVGKTFDKKLEDMTGKDSIEISRAMIESASHGRIDRISGSLNVVSEYFEVSNTNGLSCSEKATYISGTINADSSYGNTPVSGVGSASCRTLSSFNPDSIGTEAKEMCISSINPQTCESGTYSIIFRPYAMAEMMAFVISPNFNLKTYSEKRSCFAEKMGKKIAVDEFSLFDNPHLPDGIGSKPFDDEGVPTGVHYMINSGTFSGTFSDSFHAFKNGSSTTGNAARPGSPMGRSANPIPVPSPHNLSVKEGNKDIEEMVRETKRGIIVGRLWYTYPVNPERGDFSCTARSGLLLVENGRITGPCRPVRIVHNLPELLQNISDIGNDPRNVLQWHAIPCVSPSIKANLIKVSSI